MVVGTVMTTWPMIVLTVVKERLKDDVWFMFLLVDAKAYVWIVDGSAVMLIVSESTL